MAMAEGLVRELRKQARDQGRGAQRDQRSAGGTTMRGDFSGLRERLGMPPPERPERVHESTASNRPRGAAAPPSPEGRPEANAEAPPQREHVHGEEGPPQAPTQPPDEQDAVLGRAPSAETSGGVPAAGQVQAGEPSETAKAHSGAGSHGSAPVVDPSTPTLDR
jgi:hypothetical protein